MGILFKSGGLMTTVQDGGRVGYQQFGVSVCGAADQRSFAIANHLVGNDASEAVIEVTLLGPTIEFREGNIIAITGGDLSPMIEGRPAEMYRAIKVEKGSVLSFGGVKTGCRCYIAFAGGLDIAPVMGSRATDIKAKIGGFDGRKLSVGDEIGFRCAHADLPGLEYRCAEADDFSGGEYELRVIMGPQDDAFTQKGIDSFLSTSYAVTNDFDRMGCRLEGEAVEHLGDGNIISDGISFGAVQVPSAGKPIIMMVDRQTTGGYTKIANVISVDLCKIAQLKAGDKIRFVKVTVEEAEELYFEEHYELKALRRRLDSPPKEPIAAARTFEVGVVERVFQMTIRPL